MDFVASVIAQYPTLDVRLIEPIVKNGGLSGAELWKLHVGDTAAVCLRRWPAGHPSHSHLSFIHRVVAHAYANGCPFLSVPIPNRNGQTSTRISLSRAEADVDSAKEDSRRETLWEVSPWMPGRADFCDDPNPNRLRNMMHALASFHLASAQITLDFQTSQNLQSRFAKLAEFSNPVKWRELETTKLPASSEMEPELAKEIDELRRLVVRVGPVLVQNLISGLRGLSLSPALSMATTPPLMVASNGESSLSIVLPVQPILRDVWHDHVLFSGDTVTGIIDYGAMQIDNVAFDIARLLGTIAADNPDFWHQGLAAYSELRRLSEMELKLLPWIFRSGVLLGSSQWINWLMIEKRTFRDWGLVKKRVAFHQQQLQRLIEEN